MGTIWGVRKVQSNIPMATRTTKTPAFWGYPRRPITIYTIDSYWTPIQNKTKSNLQNNYKKLPNLPIVWFWKQLGTQHTFWSWLMRCVNIEWIWWVLLKMPSEHDYVYRRTDRRADGQTDGQGGTSVPPFQLSIIQRCAASPIEITKNNSLYCTKYPMRHLAAQIGFRWVKKWIDVTYETTITIKCVIFKFNVDYIIHITSSSRSRTSLEWRARLVLLVLCSGLTVIGFTHIRQVY